MSTFGSIQKTLILLILAFCLANLFIYIEKHRNPFLSQPSVFGQGIIDDKNENIENLEHNELDGCYHVFLDVGSNIGNTVRFFNFS